MDVLEKRFEEHLELLLRACQDQKPIRSSRIKAGLFYRGRLVATGENRLKSHPFQKRFGKNEDAIFLHAETDCLINSLDSGYDFADCQLLVVRSKKDTVNKRWTRGLAKPCIGCQRAIAHFNISQVYYTLDNEGIECL